MLSMYKKCYGWENNLMRAETVEDYITGSPQVFPCLVT